MRPFDLPDLLLWMKAVTVAVRTKIKEKCWLSALKMIIPQKRLAIRARQMSDLRLAGCFLQSQNSVFASIEN